MEEEGHHKLRQQRTRWKATTQEQWTKVMSTKGRGQETALTQAGIGLGKGSWTRHPGEAWRWGWVSCGVSCRSLGNGEGSKVIG